MRTILLILLLVSFFNLPLLRSQCPGFTGTASIVTQGCSSSNCGLILASPTGGTAPYTYQLYRNGAPVVGATTNPAQICVSGLYYYEILDVNSCIIFTNTASYNQATTPLSVVSTYTITNYMGFPVSCTGNTDACIKVIATGGVPGSTNTGYTYDLGAGPVTTDTFCNLGTGVYNITVTDLLGCTATSAITLSAPSVDSIDVLISSPNCAAANGAIQVLSICGGCTYSIDGNTPQSQSFFAASVGIHYLSIYNSYGCLVNYDSVLVVPTSPNTVSINAPTLICENDTTAVSCQINANTSPYTYLWDNGETSAVVYRNPGIVEVTVTDVNGCEFSAVDTILAIPLLDSVFISSSLDPFGYGHCVDADSTILGVSLFTGSLITNGIFYGPGVRNGAAGSGVALFYPDSAEIDMGHIGDLEISYVYQTTSGCWDTTSFDTRVHALPNLFFLNIPDSLCPAEDSFQIQVANIANFGSMGQFYSVDSLINQGTFISNDVNGNYIPNFIQLFDSLYPIASLGYAQVNVTYSYTSSSIFGLCSSTIEDSIIITDCCVWPGDTDNDGIANNFDLLPIGLHYGNTGLSRNLQTIDYSCHDADNWNVPISGLPLVDQKHVDCDGNGFINGVDTTAILLNWSQTHLKNTASSNAAVTMYLDTAVTNPGDTVVLDIVLNQGVSPSSSYGLAFTVNYDPSLIDTNSVRIIFDNSWLGTINTDMIGIQKDFYNQGEVEVGLTRIDQTSVVGSGAIAQMHFIIKDDVLPKTLSTRLDLSIDNILLIDNLGIEIPVTGLMSQVLIINPPLSKTQILNTKNEIKISPNPSGQYISIYSSLETIQEIELYNITGQLLKQWSNVGKQKDVLDIEMLSNGVYILTVRTANSKKILRIIKK